MIMTSAQGVPVTKSNGLVADYPEPAWASYVLNACVFVGAMVGMIVLGFAADVLGRKKGMVLTLSLAVAGHVQRHQGGH